MPSFVTETSLLGKGIYGFSDAARFIGAPARSVRRWVARCVDAVRRDGTTRPLWTSELAHSNVDAISFKDLMELRFVNAFRLAGVSLPIIRSVFDAARVEFKTPYPFSCQRFCGEGRRIFEDIASSSREPAIADVQSRQKVVRAVMGASLRTGLELSDDGDIARWYPVPDSKIIVLDPRRRFGDSILSVSGISTAAIEDLVNAERGNERFVARVYDIAPEDVREAVAFERRIRGE